MFKHRKKSSRWVDTAFSTLALLPLLRVQLPVSLICDLIFIAFDECKGWDFIYWWALLRVHHLVAVHIWAEHSSELSSWLLLHCTGRHNNHTTTIPAVLLMNWPHILYIFQKIQCRAWELLKPWRKSSMVGDCVASLTKRPLSPVFLS